MGLNVTAYVKVCKKKDTQLKVCFGGRSCEFCLSSVLSMCLSYDAFCILFSESTVQPMQSSNSTTLARAHYFQY